MTDEVLVFDLGRPEDAQQVIQLHRDHFLTTPPIRQIHFWDEAEENRTAPWSESFIRKSLAAQPPVSLVVREKSTGHLVAYKMNELDERNTFTPMPPSDSKAPGWLARALAAHLERDTVETFFDQFKTDRLLSVFFGLVRPDYRRLGINKRLDQLSYDLARSMRVGAVWHVAFSDYAGRHLANQLIKSIDYATFELADGSRPLAGVDMSGHKSARLIVRPVD